VTGVQTCALPIWRHEYHFGVAVEALRTRNTEMVFMPPTGYILAADRFGAELVAVVVREGRAYYRGLILYNQDFAQRNNLTITSLFDLEGKPFLFVKEESTSGNTFPRLLMKSRGIDPETFFSRTSFSGGHQQSVNAIYEAEDPERDFYVGAVFDDARITKAGQFPDIYEKLSILDVTPRIPNDPVVIRPNLDGPGELPAELRDGKPTRRYIQDALFRMSNNWEGRQLFLDMGQVESFVYGRDIWYDIVRSSYYSVSE
jgi:phosphonate transport system substrate-binding protein